MDTLFQDMRYGARMLLKKPTSSLIAALALALGIGLTAMMFSIIWGAMLRGLPFEKSEQLVSLSRTNKTETDSRMGVSIHDYQDWRAQQRSLVDIAAYYTGTVNVSGIDRPERFDGGFITSNAFALVGAQPVLGRGFVAADDAPGAERVMLLGYETWQNRFGGSTDVIGRVVRANAVATTIIGVMPQGFRFPNSEQLWLPLSLDAAAIPRNEGMWLQVFGRMKDGISVDQVNVELAAIAARLETAYPATNKDLSASAMPYIKAFIGREPTTMLYTMLGAVFMVLLIACANVANLLIARAAARSREVGVRTAMGATRVRIVRQFLTESMLLALGGAVVGLGLAWIGIRAFNNAIAPTDPPFWIDIKLDAGPLLFVLAITLMASLIAGAIPAWQAARANVGDVLKDESRGGSSFRLGRISRALVVVEIALSAGLLVGAGLIVKSVTKVRTAEFPFATANVFTARIGLPEVQYPDAAAQRAFFERVAPRLRELPSVAKAGLIQGLPGVGSPATRFALEGTTYQEDRDFPEARSIVVTPGTFDALGTSVRQGRDFTEQDRVGALPVAIVNEAFARRFFENGEVMGRRIRLGAANSEQPWLTIVGLVPDMYVGGLDNDDVPHAIYLPMGQASARFMSVVAQGRTNDPLELTQPVRDAVLGLDGDLPIYFVQTLKQAINQAAWFYMVFGTLFMVFGGVALFLASVGLYGVMSNSVSQRTREMGVRMALGAKAGDVLRLVMRQGLVQLTIGLVLGLALALGVSNLLQLLLFEVNPRDPLVFVAIGVVLTLTAAAACLIPATRATRVHPMSALRYD